MTLLVGLAEEAVRQKQFDPAVTAYDKASQRAAELGETAVGSDHYQVLFTIGIFLFLITFIINLTADLIVRGIRKG